MTDGKITVLTVDDEPNNLAILSTDLEDAGYNVVSANDGLEAWNILNEKKNKIQAILLDRMMPNMDGMEFMKKIKETPDFSSIPVIMQTAAAEKEQVAQGIEAGVYYYLTKPYDVNIMLSILHAAIVDYANYRKLRDGLKKFTRKLNLVKNAIFEISTLDDAEYLATFLAQFFPNPEKVVFGLSELMVNAIEHGNLGISYDEKTELNKKGIWQEEIERRIELTENKYKRANVSFLRESSSIILSIKDEGKGFEWEKYTEISPDRATDNHGRGIALSKLMSFHDIKYLGNGNEVVCKISLE